MLDADVSLDVVRSFTARVRDRALGAEVSEALNPAQQVVKIVNDELTDILGQGVDRPLNFAKNPPTIIMLAGLQGAGKTTLAGKLGYWLKDSGHTPASIARSTSRRTRPRSSCSRVCRAPARRRSQASSATGSRIPGTRHCSWRPICSVRTR